MINFFTTVGVGLQERRETDEYAEASRVNYRALAAHDHDWSSWLHRGRIWLHRCRIWLRRDRICLHRDRIWRHGAYISLAQDSSLAATV